MVQPAGRRGFKVKLAEEPPLKWQRNEGGGEGGRSGGEEPGSLRTALLHEDPGRYVFAPPANLEFLPTVKYGVGGAERGEGRGYLPVISSFLAPGLSVIPHAGLLHCHVVCMPCRHPRVTLRRQESGLTKDRD